MKKLEDSVKSNGTTYFKIWEGMLQDKETQNDKKVYIYTSKDYESFELFIPKVAKEESILGRNYPEREVYPNINDFGKTAWCYTNFKHIKWHINEFFNATHEQINDIKRNVFKAISGWKCI